MQKLNNPTITAFKFESRIITAYNLLHCYLELDGLVLGIENCTEENLSANPPRLFRFKQLAAMLRAFEIDDLSSFRLGHFIEEGNRLRYEQAIAMISDGKLSIDRNNDLRQCFLTLMTHRKEMENALCFGCGAYHIGSKLLRNTYEKIWQFIWTIKENIVVIDKIIVAIISPEGKSFSVEELVRDYGFPDVDITKFDMDYL